MSEPARRLGRAELAPLRVDAYPTRKQWLAARAAPDTIGASEAAMALGVSPYGTPWSLWENKRQPRAGERVDLLQRGHRWEPAVLAEYADESLHDVLTPGEAVQQQPGAIVTLSNPRLPWLRESPDGFAIDRMGELGQVEAKTALQAHAWSPEHGIVIDRWDDAHAELVPPHYAIQGYVQLIVTDLPWVDLCALVPRFGWLAVRYVRLQRDVATQQLIEGALTEWRERHLVHGEPPELDGSEPCNRYLAKAFPSASGKQKPERAATHEELLAMTEMYELRQRIKADEARCDELRNRLLESAKGERLRVAHATGPYGQPQVSAGKRVVDLDALRTEAPDLVAKHERQGAPFATFNLYRFEQVRAAKAALEKGD